MDQGEVTRRLVELMAEDTISLKGQAMRSNNNKQLSTTTTKGKGILRYQDKGTTRINKVVELRTMRNSKQRLRGVGVEIPGAK